MRLVMVLAPILAASGWPALADPGDFFRRAITVQVDGGQDQTYDLAPASYKYVQLEQVSVSCTLETSAGAQEAIKLTFTDASAPGDALVVPVTFQGASSGGSALSVFAANLRPFYRFEPGIKVTFHAEATGGEPGLCSVGLFGTFGPAKGG